LRTFPYLIEHCIEWAREKFSDIFENPSQIFKNFKNDSQKEMQDILESLQKDCN
jgi:ubiquitin-activating enzyme E1